MKKLTLMIFLLSAAALQAQMGAITGKVTDVDNKPLFGAGVTIDNRSTGVQTDMNGNYSIEAQQGDIIRFSYLGLNTVRLKVDGQRQIFVQLLEGEAALDPVVVSYSGIPKERKKAPYAVTTIKGQEIERSAQPDLLRSIVGKVPGARITATSGASGAGTNMIIRGQSSINGNNQPLIVLDGVPFNNSTNSIGGFEGGGIVTANRILDLDPNNIASIQVLKGLSASVLYGQLGRNGVILITTKTGYYGDAKDLVTMPYNDNRWQAQEEVRQSLANERTAREIGYKSRYQNIIRYLAGEEDRVDIFKKYLPSLGADPQFYIDVHDRFKKIDPEFSSGVLVEASRLDISDTEVLRAMAFKLEEERRYDLASEVYRRVLELQPASVPTRRHLALTLAENGNVDEGLRRLKGLYKLLDMEKDPLARIILADMRQLILAGNGAAASYGLTMEQIQAQDHDLRVVVDWNREQVDLDLQLIDPDLEIASTMTPFTNSGGQILGHSAAEHGPLTYLHKGYLPGSYYLKIVYTSKETMENPDGLYVKLTVFRKLRDGRSDKEVKVIRLAGKSKLELIDRIAIL